MNIKHIILISFVSIFSITVHAQVHLFEQGRSGLVIPVFAGNVTADIQSVDFGASYVVEGKFGLTGRYGTHLSDTAFKNDSAYLLDSIPLPSGAKSKFWNIEAAMEVIEPDKVYPISIVFKLGYKLVQFEHQYTATYLGSNVELLGRKHKMHNIYTGLTFGYRFFVGTRGLIVPSLDIYPQLLVNRRRNALGLDESYDTWGIQGGGGLVYNQMFTDFLGIMVEPRIFALYNHNDAELGILARLKLGLVLQFI